MKLNEMRLEVKDYWRSCYGWRLNMLIASDWQIWPQQKNNNDIYTPKPCVSQQDTYKYIDIETNLVETYTYYLLYCNVFHDFIKILCVAWQAPLESTEIEGHLVETQNNFLLYCFYFLFFPNVSLMLSKLSKKTNDELQ